MNKDTVAFINKYENLIDNNQIEELFDLMNKETYRYAIAQDLSSALYSIGINVWEYNVPYSLVTLSDVTFKDPVSLKSKDGRLPTFTNCTFYDLTLDAPDVEEFNSYGTTIKNLTFSATCTVIPTIFCRALENVVIPSNITEISKRAFVNYVGSIVIPDTVEILHPGVFYGSDVQHVKLSKSIDMIPSQCFAYCKVLESITIPSSTDYIGKDAFVSTLALKRIDYTGTMDQWKNVFIYRGAFNDSALEEVVCSDGTLKFKKSK